MSPFSGMLAICFQQTTACPLQSLGGNNITYYCVPTILNQSDVSSLHDGGNNFSLDILCCNSITAGKMGKERRMV